MKRFFFLATKWRDTKSHVHNLQSNFKSTTFQIKPNLSGILADKLGNFQKNTIGISFTNEIPV